jgi:N-acetylglucosaminyl-diphospho-decaprenol L-rhamnosyltransferase
MSAGNDIAGARPRIAVVIVTFNSGDVLEDALESLRAQTGIDLTAVVVADNASTDGSLGIAEAADGLPVRTIQTGRNAGYAAAINIGMDALDMRKIDAVFLMNPDCRLQPDALHRLAGALREPGRGIAVPLIVNPDGTLQPSLRRRPAVGRAIVEAIIGGNRAGRIGALGELVMDSRAYREPGPTAWATGAAMLIATDAIRDLGPWDESFLLYSEETEYCLRAGDRGWTVWYEPAAVVEHIGGESGTNPVLAALVVTNKVELFRRRRGAPASWAYHAAVALGEGVRALLGRRTARTAFTALFSAARRRQIRQTITGEAGPLKEIR